jgi:8-oxo-dGTP pyrophosphatase MutT (NUDIX family)
MKLQELLKQYSQRWPQESDVVDRFLTLLQTESNAFMRSAVKGHITGSAWLVDTTGEHVLLTHHRKLGIWVQLGGHADGEQDVLSVAMKEVEEESGISTMSAFSHEIFDLDIHTIPARPEAPEHAHYDVRFAITTPVTSYIVSDESHDLAWVRISEIDSYTTEESMLRMAEKWRLLSST